MFEKKLQKWLTINAKYNIIKFFENQPSKNAKTQTVKHFGLTSLSTLNGILIKKNKIIEAVESGFVNKKRKTLEKETITKLIRESMNGLHG